MQSARQITFAISARKRLRRGQHLAGMPLYFDFWPHFLNYALRINQKGCALNSHIFAAIQTLLDPDTIIFRHTPFQIGPEDDFEIVFGLEIVMPFNAVS